MGEDLQRKDVPIFINNETGQEVSLTENDAEGVGVADYPFTVGDGISDAQAEQRGEIRHRLVRQHADGDLRGAGVESGAEGLAAMVEDADERAGRNAVGRGDIGAVDPDVAGFEAVGAAEREFYRVEIGRGRLGHAAILNSCIPDAADRVELRSTRPGQ